MVRLIYRSLGVKGLNCVCIEYSQDSVVGTHTTLRVGKVVRVSEGVRFFFPTRLPDPLRGSERPLFIVSVLIVSPT